ncbi:MAG TPA: hypothetical protein VEV17_17690 [Bryobacteraceae bacterium]|nr:hypothetical protein [Bryobacteraceae bacterium]
MKLFCVFALAALCLPAAVSPRLKQVNTVYILAMTGGMDQYLANRLTALGVFQVVTDPQTADAILTDRLGEPFEAKFKELYPPPAPSKEQHTDEAKDAAKDEAKDEAKDPAGGRSIAMGLGGGAARLSSSFNRGKGTFFLVDRKSRIVLWSVYQPPKDSTPGELSKTAARVVKHLKDDLTDKKPPAE